jgi:hypothetical protein
LLGWLNLRASPHHSLSSEEILMGSEQQFQYQRTFLSLAISRRIYNEDERYQNNPGGVPGRQQKMQADPVFKYHVDSGPRYPQRAPGLPIDQQYDAVLARDDGSFESLVIIPKRGQQFATEATPWEKVNSVLCAGSKFHPVVNAWMEVTGHAATIPCQQLLYPAGVKFDKVEEYIQKGVELYLWNHQVFDASTSRMVSVSPTSRPPGWEPFTQYNGGISVTVLPNGQVVSALGHLFTANNGTVESVMSPLDFFSPGQRLATALIRGFTRRVSRIAVAGFRLLATPTKEMALMAASRLSSRTLTGLAVSTGKAVPVTHLARRTLIMGDDLAKFRPWFDQSHPVSGFYDVFVHGDARSFQYMVREGGKEVWKDVSVRDVADMIRSKLGPNDKIRLLACEVGQHGGPAQQLANELNRVVWAPNTTVPAGPITSGRSATSFVPTGGGKFFEFAPHRGAVSGHGVTITENTASGTIRPPRK